jgi:N-acetylneuraminic acid mutarotase
MRLDVRRSILGLAPFLAAGLACAHSGTGAPGDPAPMPGPPAWHAAPPMLHSRAAHAVVATDSAIYALGGTGEGNAPVLEVERFDGTRWTVETTLPGDGLNAPAAAVVGGRIYLIGGFSTVTNVPSDRVLVYDPTGKSWSEAAPLPAPRGGHAAVVLDGRIHVIGGGNSSSTLADHSVYDPATDRWSERAPLPRSEGSPAGVASGGKLWAIGGRSGPADFGEVYVYDPAADAWSRGPSIEPRGTAGAVEYCGAIHLFGGESQARRESLGEVLRLRPGAPAWEAMEPMPTPRNFARAVRFRGSVWVVGGSSTPEPSHASVGSAVVERYAPGCG